MIQGSFGNTSGRPNLEGRVLLKDQNLMGDILFLVDTGADRSVLMANDAKNLGIQYEKLSSQIEISGIGGTVNLFSSPAFLAFTGSGSTLYVYNIDIGIAPQEPSFEKSLSVLGRDILDNWSMVYAPLRKQLQFEVLTSYHEHKST